MRLQHQEDLQKAPELSPLMEGAPGGAQQTTPGIYVDVFAGQAANGCDSILTTTLTITPLDDASFTYTNTSICILDPNPIANITGLIGGIFSIDNGGSINAGTGEIDLALTSAGSYVVTYTTNGPCPNSSVVNVTVIGKLDATITPVGPYCESDGAVTLAVVDTGGTWIGVTNGTFSPSSAGKGTHQIIYSIGTGTCGDADTIDIVVNGDPVIGLDKQDDNCMDEEGSVTATVVNGTIPYDYNWSNGGIDSAITDLPAGTYTLTVIDSIGCSATGIATVADILDNCEFHIFLPNIFSPNDDGQNDVFFVRGKGIKTLNFIIYSRWGEKVFETEDANIGWDGRFRGLDMNSAVFVYYVKATMINDEVIEQKGNVTLVR